MKNYSRLLVPFVIISLLAVAIPSVGPVDAAIKPSQFALNSAVLVGLKNSLKTKEFFVDHQLAQINVERLEETSRQGLGDPFRGADETVEWELGNKKAKGISALQAEGTRLAAEAKLRQDLQTYVTDVKSNFLTALKTKQSVSLTELQLERAKRQEANAKLSLDAGIVAQVDYESAQSNRKLAEIELQNAKLSLESSYFDLKEIIGYEPGDTVVIEGELNYQPVGQLNYEADLAKAIENSPAIIQLQLQRDVAQITYDIVRPYQPDSFIGNRENLANLQKAQAQLDQGKQALAFQLKKLHLQIQQISGQIASLDEIVAQAQRSLEVTEARYKAGMGTTLDVMQAQVGLLQAELNRLEAVFAYTNAIEARKVLIGEDREVIESFIANRLKAEQQ